MKVRACIYVNSKWSIPYIKSLEYSLIELEVTDKIDIKLPPIYSDKSYDLSFFVLGRKSINIDGWNDKCKVLLQIEQLINCRMNGGYHIGNAFDFILEPFHANMFLRGTENVYYCPIGYAPTWERPKKKVKKDIDVLFWGGLNPTRVAQLKYLKDNGIKVHYSNELYGDELYNYISRSKIIIWLTHSSQIDYAQMHCLPAQAQGEFVMVQGLITFLKNPKKGTYTRLNSVVDYGLFEPDVSFVVFADQKDLLEKVKYYLKNEYERKEFAKKAYDHLISIPYSDSLKEVICNFSNHIIEQKK